MGRETFLIVGLGNPGLQYAHSRHNVGFDVTDLLASRWQVQIGRSRCRGLVGEASVGDKRVVLCQPQTFMNLSGECVSPLLSWYDCPLDHLLVICDDIDLRPGQLRLRKKGSAGTHNGLRSIVELLPSDGFNRMRVGVGAPPEGWDLVQWVLGRPLVREEQDVLRETFSFAADAAEDWVLHGMDHAMCHYNRK